MTLHVNMPKNEHKYLAFPSENLLKAFTVQEKGYTFLILFFPKILWNKFILENKAEKR